MYNKEVKSVWRDLFVEDGFGSTSVASDAGVAANGRSFFVRCVSNFCRGIVETIVSAMSFMMPRGGVPVKFVVVLSCRRYSRVTWLQLRIEGLQCNTLREELENVCEKRKNLAYELMNVKGIIVAGKVVKFVTDTLRKDDAEMAYLHELERQMELRPLEKELCIQKLVQNASECMCLALEAYRIQAMAALPICDELCQTVNSSDWEVMFILCCCRKIAKDLRLAREINALFAHLTAIIDERENFKDELNVLAGRRMPEKMVEFTEVYVLVVFVLVTCMIFDVINGDVLVLEFEGVPGIPLSFLFESFPGTDDLVENATPKLLEQFLGTVGRLDMPV
nr:hypothetical protein [Tanacetum cinerariifolium]